jgi:hypothetical protein
MNVLIIRMAEVNIVDIKEPHKILYVYINILRKLNKNTQVAYTINGSFVDHVSNKPSVRIVPSVLLNYKEERKILEYETVIALISCKDNPDKFNKIYTFITNNQLNKHIVDYIFAEYQVYKLSIHNKKDLIDVMENIANLKNGDLFRVDILKDAITRHDRQNLVRLIYLSCKHTTIYDKYFMNDSAYDITRIIKWFAYDHECLLNYTTVNDNKYYLYLMWKERRFMHSIYLRKFLTNPSRDLTLLDLNKMICQIMDFDYVF